MVSPVGSRVPSTTVPSFEATEGEGSSDSDSNELLKTAGLPSTVRVDAASWTSARAAQLIKVSRCRGV